MNLIDIVVIALLLLFAVLGVVKGMVRQLFSLAGLVLGHIAGIRYYASAASAMKLDFRYAELVGYLAVFLAVLLAAVLVGTFIEGRVRDSKLSGIDRAGGLVLGMAKGALLSVLLVFVLVILLPKDARVLRESKAAPYAVSAARYLQKAFPARIAKSFQEKIRAAEKQPPGGPSFSY